MGITEKIKNLSTSDKSVKPSFVGRTLNIEICGRCNEQCIYCPYYANGAHLKKGMIDDDLFYRVTKEARELGIEDVGLYMVGEPMLNPKIYGYVDYLKNSLGFPYVYISTNGILMTPENLEKLAKAGIDSIKFSVSGASRETFLKHHGVDRFDEVYENIKYAFDYREKSGLKYKLYMFVILTRYNISERGLFEEIYSPYIDEMIFSPVTSVRTVRGVMEHLGIEEKSSLMSELSTKKMPCNTLFSKICIDERGCLIACCYDLISDLAVIADLHEMSLKEAVYGENFSRLREMHLKGDVSGTICDFCINGNESGISPLADVDGFLAQRIEKFDISDEIEKRFS